MTSAPVPIDHMMGMSPIMAAATVISLGRTRFTAPWTMASCRSERERSFPSALASAYERSR